jgi:hypothetical protein
MNPAAPMPAQWMLSGTVRGNGVAIGGATVMLKRQPLPALVTQTTSDTDGRYRFLSIDEGSYFVEAGAPGYVTVIVPVALTSTLTVDFNLPLNPPR